MAKAVRNCTLSVTVPCPAIGVDRSGTQYPAPCSQPGSNYLEIDLWVEPSWGRLSEVYFGPEELLRRDYARLQFWRVTVLTVTTCVTLLLAILMAMIGVRHQGSIYLWFAGFSLSWGLHNLCYLTVRVSLPNQLWDLAIYLVLGFLLVSGSKFAFRFLARPHPRFERFMTVLFLSGAVLLAAASQLAGHGALTQLAVLWNLALLGCGSVPAMLMLRHLGRARDAQTLLLAVCYLFALLTGLHDWLAQAGFGSRHRGMLLQFAAGPALVTFGLILIHRFSGALAALKSLNGELEARVAAKTREIEHAFDQRRALEAENLLNTERVRIMRDMHDGVGGHLISLLNQFDRENVLQARWASEAELALADPETDDRLSRRC